MALTYSLMFIFLFTKLISSFATSDYYRCYSNDNFSSSGGYGRNRDGLLFTLPTDVKEQGGYYNVRTGSFSYLPPSQRASVYCLGLCRKDTINNDACSICIKNSSSVITRNCPVQKEVIAWGNDAGCIVRCAPSEFPQEYETEPVLHVCNSTNVSLTYDDDLSQFRNALANLTSSIATSAADAGAKYSFSTEDIIPQYFAMDELKLTLGDRVQMTIYGLGFCLPTLFERACTACLQAAAGESENHCDSKQGAMVLTASCVLRYELYPFYKLTSVSPLPSPSLPPPPPDLSPSLGNVRKEGRDSRTFVTVVVLAVVVVLTIIGLIACIVIKIQKKRKQKALDEVPAESSGSCFEFRLNTIRVATNDFCPSNKLGQGGFGAVYKGTLTNDKQIAVKRLSVHSAHGNAEFKNEVQLVARLHHRNLVNLIGFCLGGKERILIYELAINGSLDRFLFDPIKREHLTWKIRYKIIQGIARGMLYLHEESQLRIIHRDLKASNVLLDESMNPKVSDFGTARLFPEDQCSASKIVGTYGYMAPEYAKRGKISIKIDVFSFGVLLLEIVSGKKNCTSENQKHIEHLLSKAWKYWEMRKLVELIDPILLREGGQIDEITRCIHIGLLCVQEDDMLRPSMNLVILMLDGGSQSLPPPSKPAYLMDINDDEPNEPVLADQSESGHRQSEPEPEPDLDGPSSLVLLSSSGFSSVNEVSITQPYPEPR